MSQEPPGQISITEFTAADLRLLQDIVTVEMEANMDGCIGRGLGHFNRVRGKPMTLADLFYLWIPLAERIKNGEDITIPQEQHNFTVEPSPLA